MPQFTYTDSEVRVYPYTTVNGEALIATPGETYTLDADPADGRWVATTSTPTPTVAPQTPPVAPQTPATPATDPTTTN